MARPLRLEFAGAGIAKPSPWHDLKNQIYLGSECFIERLQAMIDPDRPLTEIPQRQRRPVEKPLAYYATHWSDRNRAIAEAYRSGAYSMRAIAEYFDVSRMTVSRAVKHDKTEHSSNNVQ